MRIAAAMGMLAATAAFLATGPGGHAEGAVGASSGAGFFTSACGYSHSGPDDPIVKPGRPGGTHMHDFLGNESTDAHATLGSLRARGTRCRRAGDRSAYWVPSLVRRGRRIAPRGANVYYRTAGRRPRSIRPFPAGLRVVAGDARARKLQDARVTQWGCTRAPGRRARVFAPRSRVPTCPRGTRLRMIVRFPDCWDARNLDSADHSSHLAYAWRTRRGRACPPSHPVAVPTLGLDVIYPVRSGSGAQLSSGPPRTGHADFFNAWDPQALKRLVRRCLTRAARCGNR